MTVVEVPADIQDMFKQEPTANMDETADQLVEAQLKYERLKKEKDEQEALVEQLETDLSDQMIAKGIKSIKRKDGIQLISVIRNAFYVKEGEKPNLIKTLKHIGDGALVKEDVGWQSMNAYMKSLVEVATNENLSQSEKELELMKLSELGKYVEKTDKKGITIKGLKNKV